MFVNFTDIHLKDDSSMEWVKTVTQDAPSQEGKKMSSEREICYDFVTNMMHAHVKWITEITNGGSNH